MPILSLIPTTENVFGGLPRIAKLRKGAPKEQRKRKDGSTYEVVGRDLDHLRVQFDPEYEHFKPVFTQLYGKEPKEFAAYLNADTVHEAFDFWNEEWTATTMLRRCDGKHKHVWYNEQTGFYQNAKVMCDSTGKGCGCKAVGRLNVILPEFTTATGVIGYFTIETHSEEDIRTLYARITSIWATFSRLRGIPLVFYRVPRKTSTPDVKTDGTRTGKRRNITRHMLDCRIDPEYTKEHFLPALTGMRAQLPPPPVSTISMPSTQRSIQLLNTGGSRRVEAETTSNGHQVDTVTGEVLPAVVPDDTEEIIIPPDWYTQTNRALMLNRLKEEDKLMVNGQTWDDLLKMLEWKAEDCYRFNKGNEMYQHIKPILVAKKNDQPPAPAEPVTPAVINSPFDPNSESERRAKELAMHEEAKAIAENMGKSKPLTKRDAIPMSPEELALAEKELAAIDASIDDIPPDPGNPHHPKHTMLPKMPPITEVQR